MGVSLENFNRIIDISFLSSTGQVVKSLYCPRKGRKPRIEINAKYGSALVLMAMNITIKNLYVDYRNESFSRIKVRAGYANNYTTFEADILSMYPESPGPEGTTIIQCNVNAKITQTWLDSTVSLKFDKGAMLTDILSEIKKQLGVSEVLTGKVAKTLALEAPLQFDGSVRDACNLLMQRFIEKQLQIIMQGSNICAFCEDGSDYIKERTIEYMSAPPQKNPGDEDGGYYMTITAPWIPDLLPGDLLVIPTTAYFKNFSTVGATSTKQKMKVQTMAIHFGTCGTVNQMTCTGNIVREV